MSKMLLSETGYPYSRPESFLDLPRELREKVYEYFFENLYLDIRVRKLHDGRSETLREYPSSRDQSILCLNKQVYTEALRIFHRIDVHFDLRHTNRGEITMSSLVRATPESHRQHARAILIRTRPQSFLFDTIDGFGCLRSVDLWLDTRSFEEDGFGIPFYGPRDLSFQQTIDWIRSKRLVIEDNVYQNLFATLKFKTHPRAQEIDRQMSALRSVDYSIAFHVEYHVAFCHVRCEPVGPFMDLEVTIALDSDSQMWKPKACTLIRIDDFDDVPDWPDNYAKILEDAWHYSGA